MRDEKVTLPRIMTLHPKIRNEVVSIISTVELGFPQKIKVRVVQALRTKKEQDELYSQGRTSPGSIVTNAKFGQSFHCFGLAIDFAIMYDLNGDGIYETLSWDTEKDLDEDGTKDWDEVVRLFKTFTWKWGGDFNSIQDDPHLEKTFGYSWRELLDKYNKKDFIGNSMYINL